MPVVTDLLDDTDMLAYRACCLPGAETEDDLRLCFDHHFHRLIQKFAGAKLTLVLSNSDRNVNHRFDIAVTKPYKGQRKPKPSLYTTARYILLDEYAAVVTGFGEGDDLLGCLQTPNSCIVSGDKDLLMIPGRHFNPRTGREIIASDPGKLWIEITGKGHKKCKGYGFMWFCAQMIIGDRVDNIEGIKGKGDIFAWKTLNKIKTKGEMINMVYTLYKKNKMSIQRFFENADLLWIMRQEKEYFCDWIINQEELHDEIKKTATK